MRASVVLVVLVAAMSFRAPALEAHGPGAHVREADRTLELLAEGDEEWAALAEAPMAQSYLRLGSIAPDFQWITGALSFGHSKSLSYHLLEASEGLEPRFRLFALGHLAHLLSDANAEMFLTPTVFGTVPLGLVNVFEGSEDLEAESEQLCEGFGDMLFGDWVSVVDLIYDFYLDGEEAVERAREILGWYCEEGELHHARPTDCERVVADILSALGAADDLLPANRRDGARVIELIVGGSARSVLDVYAGGLLSFLLGTDSTPSRVQDRELDRIRRSPLGERSFWEDLYESHFLDLAPAWTIDHLRTGHTGWPHWEPRGIISGNIQSIMGFVDEYDVVPGLLVDEIVWRRAGGDEVSGVSVADEGEEGVVSLRFYSTMPWAGRVRGEVRADMEGLGREGDEVLGEASWALDIDPATYTERARDVLEIPFVMRTADALGFYVELTVEGREGPFFTTSVDRFWRIDELDLDEPIYRDNLRTYGGFPESLRVVDAVPRTATVSVKIRTGPAGFGVGGAEVEMVGEDRRLETGPGGVVTFDLLEPGAHRLRASGEVVVEPAEATVELEAGEHAWVVLDMVQRPRVTGPEGWSANPECWSFGWNPRDFGNVHVNVEAAVLDAQGEDLTRRTLDRPVRRICVESPVADGTELMLAVRPVFEGEVDERFSREGRSQPFRVDSTPPELRDVVPYWVDDVGCGSLALLVMVQVEEPHSPLVEAVWKRGGAPERDAVSLVTSLPEGGSGTVQFVLDRRDVAGFRALDVGLVNAAGLVGWASVELPHMPDHHDECEETSTPEPTEAPASTDAGSDPEETDPGAEPGETAEEGGCGCAAGGRGGSSAWALLLMALLLGRRRRG